MAVPAIPLPGDGQPSRQLPDYLPARMVNEYVYCRRLFFYEWVEGVFRESVDTVEGSAQHKRVDKPSKGLPAAEDLGNEQIHSRSAMLSSERLRVIAKMDLIEVIDGAVTPVDYKHGRPREEDDALVLWPADRVQLALQAIVLRENGYSCEEGVVYYQATKTARARSIHTGGDCRSGGRHGAGVGAGGDRFDSPASGGVCKVWRLFACADLPP